MNTTEEKQCEHKSRRIAMLTDNVVGYACMDCEHTWEMPRAKPKNYEFDNRGGMASKNFKPKDNG